jgi:diketogulonate reductase-like aldo/keto reductase
MQSMRRCAGSIRSERCVILLLKWACRWRRSPFAWVLANPTITSAILGASRVDQLSNTLSAVDLKIDDDLKKRLNELIAEYRRGDAVR